MKETLKKLYNKSRLSAEDKSVVSKIADHLGIEVKIDGRCPNCWHDLIAECYNRIVEDDPSTSWFKPQYKGGIRVNGVAVFCEANMDEEKAQWLRNNGLEKYLNPLHKNEDNEVPADSDNED